MYLKIGIQSHQNPHHGTETPRARVTTCMLPKERMVTDTCHGHIATDKKAETTRETQHNNPSFPRLLS